MSLITNLERLELQRNVGHKPALATYSIVTTDSGEKQLQIDTYGSSERADKTPGHRAYSLPFTKEAILELKQILAKL
jgi:hypothetical protein